MNTEKTPGKLINIQKTAKSVCCSITMFTTIDNRISSTETFIVALFIIVWNSMLGIIAFTCVI